jgi:hypothetical protein
MDGGAVTNTIGGGQVATFDPLLGSKKPNKKKRLRDIINNTSKKDNTNE